MVFPTGKMVFLFCKSISKKEQITLYPWAMYYILSHRVEDMVT